jgi:hypothetical protein
MLHSASVEKLHIVILYERLACVSKAMAAYAHLARELAADFTPDFRVWRLDVVLKPARAAEAGRDLASAGVIIMAVDGRRTCPRAFRHWLDGDGPAGGGPPRAIFAFTEGIDEPGTAPAEESWMNVVRKATTQISDGIFICEPAPFPVGNLMDEPEASATNAETLVHA